MTYSAIEVIVSGKRSSKIGSSNEIAGVARQMVGTALMLCALVGIVTERAWGEQWSLARDFSSAENENDSESTWSYRLDDRHGDSSSFPLLKFSERNANEIWGSNFATPPKMWSGKNGLLVHRQERYPVANCFSSRNKAKWPVGEVLLHPKGGTSPAGLVVGWTSPKDQVVVVRYSFELASPQSGGIGYSILKRSDMGDTQIVALRNIGSEITNQLNRVAVSQGQPVVFPIRYRWRSRRRHHPGRHHGRRPA